MVGLDIMLERTGTVVVGRLAFIVVDLWQIESASPISWRRP